MKTEISNPRLLPITSSWNPVVWFAMLVYRLTTGRVGAPVRVLFARAPRLIFGHLTLMATAEYGLSLDRRIRALSRVFGSRVNACMFCDDLESYMALKSGAITREDIDAFPEYATSPRFSEAERAVLRYVEEINTSRTASDEVFSALKLHFSEKEIVELTWLNAVGNYLNLQARPLGIGSQGYCPLPATRDPQTAEVAKSAP